MSAVKQTPPRSFSILIKDSHLREIDLHETSKRTVLTNLHSKRLNYVRLLVLIEIHPRRLFLDSFDKKKDAKNIQEAFV